ncbi:MAG: hypothetical protein ABIZ81_08250 [Opitutaceae bacterium]
MNRGSSLCKQSSRTFRTFAHSTSAKSPRGITRPQLVNAARQHAPEAWDTLLQRHQLPLYTYIAELLRDDAKFASWLFGIAHQKCVQHWRRARRTEATHRGQGSFQVGP